MQSHVERETKWDVEPDVPLTFDVKTGADQGVETVELTNTYYDTDDLDLLNHGVTLRYREGDESDHGWQVKVPTDEGRIESTFDGDSTTVPTEVADMLWGLRLGRDLGVAAIIHTRRTRHRHLDAKGRLRYEIADDTVSATVPGPVATATTWREIEVELGPQSRDIPKSVRKRLLDVGARPADAATKLARAVGYTPLDTPRRGSAASDAVARYMRTQLAAIFAGDVALRLGEDPIHDTRVAIRRLRSTLRTSAKLFDAELIAGADDELKWFAGLLGEVRDRQVQRARFVRALDAIPAEMVLGPVGKKIDDELAAEQDEHRAKVTEAMVSDRYRDMLEMLVAWDRALPFVDTEVRTKQLRKIVARADRKADKRLTEAVATGIPEDLHRARKAAKRARYASELGRPVLGKKQGKAQVKKYKKIQTILGEHQDAAVAAESLRKLGARAGVRRGENGFTYGMLYQRELAAAEAARAKVIARRR
ncbi:CYTH and CHAD domain-containing protein [Gordonia sp. PKS22-38]|uniref:CYTH and CHAD domain-containing protein n=1 Tax=Gordonia prachuapensis TaxID=3115651 RepID=A0ABU7MYB4_9ACTN|nr:CYTH and CHAD domain-containing protein [Gordonia sp. PKS22-38]